MSDNYEEKRVDVSLEIELRDGSVLKEKVNLRDDIWELGKKAWRAGKFYAMQNFGLVADYRDVVSVRAEEVVGYVLSYEDVLKNMGRSA